MLIGDSTKSEVGSEMYTPIPKVKIYLTFNSLFFAYLIHRASPQNPAILNTKSISHFLDWACWEVCVAFQASKTQSRGIIKGSKNYG